MIVVTFAVHTILALPGKADGPVTRTKRPNVLIILPDQLRAQAIGCMGNPDVSTPNMDRLASQGILVRNTFANTPVCCPARAIVLTGKYAHKNGMVANDLRLRESETTLAEILSVNGYRTGFIGKWHLDGGPRLPGYVPPGPRRQGFSYWAANECDHSHFRPTYFRNSDVPITEERFEPEVWTDRAIEFLKAPSEDPFFLFVSMGPPHDPYGAPDRYMARYDPAKISMRPNWREGVPGAGRKEIAAYYAAVTAVDDQIGRLLQALNATGREDETIVIVTSDHGDMLGSHGLRLKRKPHEESIHVPGIIRYPSKIKAGMKTDAILSHVDLAPSLLALCGLPVPKDMQGTDQSAVMTGTAERATNLAFFQIFVPFAGDKTPKPWRGVRTETHLYAKTSDGPWLLFDLTTDPYEMKNLSMNPEYATVRNQLDEQLNEWMKKTGDTWSNDSTATVEDDARLYKSRAFYSIQEYLEWSKSHPEAGPKR